MSNPQSPPLLLSIGGLPHHINLIYIYYTQIINLKQLETMSVVNLNARQVTNDQTGSLEIQGTAILKTIGKTILENDPQDGNPKKYKIGTIAFNAGNGTEVVSAQIFEKTYNGNPEKGTEPVAIGDTVSINISADDTNTYFRVIGVGGGGLQSKDMFAALLGGARPVVAQEQEEEHQEPAMGGDEV